MVPLFPRMCYPYQHRLPLPLFLTLCPNHLFRLRTTRRQPSLRNPRLKARALFLMTGCLFPSCPCPAPLCPMDHCVMNRPNQFLRYHRPKLQRKKAQTRALFPILWIVQRVSAPLVTLPPLALTSLPARALTLPIRTLQPYYQCPQCHREKLRMMQQ